MKKYKLSLCSLAISILALSSCTQQKEFKDQMDDKKTICYMAIDKTDTAWLKVDTSKKQVLGELEFNYHNEKHFVGTIKGVVKGDTLKGHYVFKVNNVDKWYRNPIALLKKENTLTMGVGDIRVMWGAVYFNQNVPIDYDKGRFVFEQAACIIKTTNDQ